MTPLLLAAELTLILAIWLAIGAWQRGPRARARGRFSALALAVALWCAGLILLGRGAVDSQMATRIAVLGALLVPGLWLSLSVEAANLAIGRKLRWLPYLVTLPALVFYPFLYLGTWGEMLFVKVPAGPGPIEAGPLYWVLLGYAYTLVLLGSAVLGWSAVQADQRLRSERLLLGLGSLVPLVGNVLWVVSDFDSSGDPTPILIGVTLLILRRALVPGRLLDALPIAQRNLIEHLPLGVVLADSRGVVIDVNPAGQDMLGLPHAGALGRALDAVLAEAPSDLKIQEGTARTGDAAMARFAILTELDHSEPRIPKR